ncbi:hypothetical protein D1BOALGB6SA_7932 [Olavius sp. associated proteobacterium Delta 1]|nr:hypothetical protein D1BOALGB6SA_7932 [Olavius sp. associated proteobacterium Delta 1]
MNAGEQVNRVGDTELQVDIKSYFCNSWAFPKKKHKKMRSIK